MTNRLRIHTLMGLVMGTLPPSSALAQDDGAEKGLRVAEETDDLKVQFVPTKKAFSVGEPITFRVKGNREFFLFLFGKDPSGQSVLILPNEVDEMNKYPAGRSIEVPNDTVSFRADQAGFEEITMIASTKHLQFDRSRYAKSGAFSTLSEDEAAVMVKGIQVADEEKPERRDVVRKQLEVQVVEPVRSGIRAGHSRRATGSSDAVVMVRTDRARYEAGDEGRLVYASTHAGFIRLKMRNPDGSETMLTEEPRRVKANQVYTVEFVAEAPFGEQAIIAELVEARDRSEAATAAKGISLRADDAHDVPTARDEHWFEVGR